MQTKSIEIVEAANPVEILTKNNYHSFDLLIIDIKMPVISGYEFIHMLKEQSKYLPIIILTSQDVVNYKSLESHKAPIKIINKDLSLKRILTKIDNFVEQFCMAN